MMLLLLTIHFYYRYLSVTGSPNLARFHLRAFPIWLLFLALNNSIWFVLSYYFHGESEMKNQVVAPDFLKIYCLEQGEYTYLGPQYFFKNNATGKFECHTSSFLSAGTICVIMSVTFSLLIHFGSQTYYHLYKLGQIARFDSQNLQKQLFRTLVIQTCIPSVFMYLPVTCLFIFPLFGVTVDGLSSFIPISVAIYPCFEPMVAIYCIKPFRMRMIAILTGCYHSKNTVNTFALATIT
ncbi:hypothetical protein GCK72_020450 [Caenorhabditis remanei]|uniref:Seven TM Receptor n=1 Tax=Caenorhabditis remanei TaxID=31234 RepID=A0A6A5GGU0_CAERE|nr:hypothetical protein GCK72_020450 [Caenorhabditis remanei]KAF1753893.1 hypothetical protein GCK72_020450 [Caenorhabditis remanei]